jgi:hypothetical protein
MYPSSPVPSNNREIDETRESKEEHQGIATRRGLSARHSHPCGRRTVPPMLKPRQGLSYRSTVAVCRISVSDVRRVFAVVRKSRWGAALNRIAPRWMYACAPISRKDCSELSVM